VPDTNSRYTGKVKFYNSQKGFGFIKADDGSADVFVGQKSLPREVESLMPDQKVSYVIKDGKKGPAADKLALL
jgi:cold shock protein